MEKREHKRKAEKIINEQKNIKNSKENHKKTPQEIREEMLKKLNR